MGTHFVRKNNGNNKQKEIPMKKWIVLIASMMIGATAAYADSCSTACDAKEKASCEMKKGADKAECAADKAACKMEAAKDKAACAADKKCCGTCKGDKAKCSAKEACAEAECAAKEACGEKKACGKKWYNPVSWFK